MYVTLRSVPKSSDEVASTSVLRRRRIPSAVLAFGVVSMLTDVSSESVAAVLPLYITAVLGMGPLAYGFIDGIYQGVSAAVRILGGWWSDLTKRPKHVAFVGYLASARHHGRTALPTAGRRAAPSRRRRLWSRHAERRTEDAGRAPSA